MSTNTLPATSRDPRRPGAAATAAWWAAVIVLAGGVLPRVVAAAEPATQASGAASAQPPGPPAKAVRDAAPPKPPAVDWRNAAREVARTKAGAAETATAIERTRAEDVDADAIEKVEVVGVDKGEPKRGDTTRGEGGQVVTWIDGNCYYAPPPSPLDAGASTRLWVPTCKPASWRALRVGKGKRGKPVATPSAADVAADAAAEAAAGAAAEAGAPGAAPQAAPDPVPTRP